MGRRDYEIARREIREAAKVLQSRFEAFAGEAGGARIWVERRHDEVRSHLCALIWSNHEDWCSLDYIGRRDWLITCMRDYPMIHEFDEHFGGDNILRIEVLSSDQYLDRYFFNKPPFCNPNMG